MRTRPLPMPFDADHPPAGWRSILDVPPISVLAPIFASPFWMQRFQRGTEIQAYSATCSGLKQLGIALGRTTPKIRHLRDREGGKAPARPGLGSSTARSVATATATSTRTASRPTSIWTA